DRARPPGSGRVPQPGIVRVLAKEPLSHGSRDGLGRDRSGSGASNRLAGAREGIAQGTPADMAGCRGPEAGRHALAGVGTGARLLREGHRPKRTGPRSLRRRPVPASPPAPSGTYLLSVGAGRPAE